jgi:hypothetical protein
MKQIRVTRGKIVYELDENEKGKIREMFWGPYKAAWRDKNGIVDNRDDVIAKRLNLPYGLVTIFITRDVERYFNRLISNKEDEEAINNRRMLDTDFSNIDDSETYKTEDDE